MCNSDTFIQRVQEIAAAIIAGARINQIDDHISFLREDCVDGLLTLTKGHDKGRTQTKTLAAWSQMNENSIRYADSLLERARNELASGRADAAKDLAEQAVGESQKIDDV